MGTAPGGKALTGQRVTRADVGSMVGAAAGQGGGRGIWRTTWSRITSTPTTTMTKTRGGLQMMSAYWGLSKKWSRMMSKVAAAAAAPTSMRLMTMTTMQSQFY
jgi:hypothetical protein